MAEEKNIEQPKLTNQVSDETGQYDTRFMLWRQFCAEHNVDVETLPSQLEGEAKENWAGYKEALLKRLGK
jgi:hypothetical protein